MNPDSTNNNLPRNILPGANPRKTQSIVELGAIDIATVREHVDAIPEAMWDEQNGSKPNHFDVLGRTQHIVFRFIRDVHNWRDSASYPLWEQWRDVLQPVLDAATRPYGYTRFAYPRIMLARMPPGSFIQPHRDMNRSARWPHKIHVPIRTNAQVGFFIDPTTYHLAEGQAYEVNNLGTHAVENGGVTARTHLIFEYYDLDQPGA